LRHHWGTAYSITYYRGQWLAARHDTREVLTAESASELRKLMREDYCVRPGTIWRGTS
jgi:hypothetical protein